MVRYKNTLMPLDSCGQSEPILSQLPPLVRQTGITVHLLSVYPPTMHTVVGRHVVIFRIPHLPYSTGQRASINAHVHGHLSRRPALLPLQALSRSNGFFTIS